MMIKEKGEEFRKVGTLVLVGTGHTTSTLAMSGTGACGMRGLSSHLLVAHQRDQK